MPPIHKTIVGLKKNRLTALYRTSFKGKPIKYMFLCDCGVKKEIKISYFVSEKVKSCGCLHSETARTLSFKHGMRNTRQYRIWDNMIRRCKNPKASGYKSYGKRGILVCKRWKNFILFWKDMKDGYSNILTLDRINNNKGYCKKNCKWSSLKEQANNTSRNHFITFNGETLNIRQWENKLDYPKGLINKRIIRGWSIEDAIKNKPLNSRWERKKFNK